MTSQPSRWLCNTRLQLRRWAGLGMPMPLAPGSRSARDADEVICSCPSSRGVLSVTRWAIRFGRSQGWVVAVSQALSLVCGFAEVASVCETMSCRSVRRIVWSEPFASPAVSRRLILSSSLYDRSSACLSRWSSPARLIFPTSSRWERLTRTSASNIKVHCVTTRACRDWSISVYRLLVQGEQSSAVCVRVYPNINFWTK